MKREFGRDSGPTRSDRRAHITWSRSECVTVKAPGGKPHWSASYRHLLPLETMANNGEQAPLLGDPAEENLARNPDHYSDLVAKREAAARRHATIRKIIYGVLALLFGVTLVVLLLIWDRLGGGNIGNLPQDPAKAALIIMKSSPAIVSA